MSSILEAISDTIVFYPAMGVDIFTPLLCVPKVDKIIACGPLPEQFGKSALEQTIRHICNFVNTGTNDFYEGKYVDDDEEFIEFLPEEGNIVKKFNFKSKGMYLVTFKYNERLVRLYYYYKVLPEALDNMDWPFEDKFDYVIHKGYKMNVYPSRKCKTNFLVQLRKHLKDTTVLISTRSDIRGVWEVPKERVVKRPNEGYEFVVKQSTMRLDGPFQSLYEVPNIVSVLKN